MKKLPLLISIPHGGEDIPEELTSKTTITLNDIRMDGDTFTRDIYDFSDIVIASHSTNIARACIDLNRAPYDRAPQNPDGIIKSVTALNKPVYSSGQFPDDSLITRLLNKYYFPYHYKLDWLIKSRNIKLALDCHSMLEKSPLISNSPGIDRPLFCISNAGDAYGNATNSGKPGTCSFELINLMADCIKNVFEIDGNEVGINSPFKGGYIIRSHCKNSVPWLQIEINRKLYLEYEDASKTIIRRSQEKITELRNRMYDVMKKLISHMSI